MLFTREQQLKLISAVANAPSVHNVQPARFHFTGDNIYLLEDLTRRIPCGDPMGRDNRRSGLQPHVLAHCRRVALSSCKPDLRGRFSGENHVNNQPY